MKVLIVSHQFFPEFYTGTERFSLNLAHQLQRMGHGVEVVTYGVKDGLGRFDNRSGDILWREYVYEGLKVTAIKHRGQPARLNFSVFNEAVLSFFRDFLSGKEFDVVHLTHPMRVGAVAIAAKERHLPCVLTLTDFWLLCANAKLLKTDYSLCMGPNSGEACVGSCFGRSMGKELTDRCDDCETLLTMMDAICAPSRFLAGMFRASYPNSCVEVIRHGIDYRWLPGVGPAGVKKRKDDRVRFCYLGTILRHKGVDVLIRAFRSVPMENIRLDIYGGYFHEKSFFEKLKGLAGKDDRIVFRGEYEHRDVGDILSETDAVMVPSVWWENSPLTILTSHAYRVPVIASDIGGMAEFVENDVNGYTFHMGDSKTLAARIQKIAEAPQSLSSLRDHIELPPRIEEEAFQYIVRYRASIKKKDSGDSSASDTEVTPKAETFVPEVGTSSSVDGTLKDQIGERPIFIIGSERSGTTVLSMALREGAGIEGYGEGHLLPLAGTLIREIHDYYDERKEFLCHPNLMISDVDISRFEQNIYRIFRDIADSCFQKNIWIDKTPGGTMIDTAPVLLRIWPEAKFIFAKRRGIECLSSRLKKFPNLSFKTHCKMWVDAMTHWLDVKPMLAGHYIEVDQRDISLYPGSVSEKIGTFLALRAEQIKGIQEVFSESRPEYTGGSEFREAIDISETGWTDTQINTFRKYCASVFTKYGYSETSSYYKKN